MWKKLYNGWHLNFNGAHAATVREDPTEDGAYVIMWGKKKTRVMCSLDAARVYAVEAMIAERVSEIVSLRLILKSPPTV